MNYEKIYENLINKRKSLPCTENFEMHHITPKCIGGSNDKDNLVTLSYREHFLAHQLLVKIYPDVWNLTVATFLMTNHKRYVGSRNYERVRSQYYNNVRGNTYEDLYGEEKSKLLRAIRSAKMKELNSLGIVGGKGKDNPMHPDKCGLPPEYFQINLNWRMKLVA